MATESDTLLEIMKIMPPPEKPIIMSNESWVSFEKTTSLIFPQEFKDFISKYGCGSINRIVFIYSPYCVVGNKETQHESNLEQWKLDMELRKDNIESFGHDDRETPLLYPEPTGVYVWGGDGENNSYGWFTETNDGKLAIIPDKIAIFDTWETKPSAGKFYDFILKILRERFSPGSPLGQPEYIPFKIN